MTMQFQLKSIKDRASRRSILKLLLISIPVALTRNTMALLRPMARTAEPLLLSKIKTAQEGERMPLVRIDLIEGKLPEYRASVGEVVYDKLIAVFGVPKNDRFQVITEHPKTGLHFDPNYLGIHRSDACVFIQITLNSGRTVEQKQQFYKAVADGLHNTVGLRREDVFINLVEVPKENWSFGNGEAQYVTPTP
jgi:phenylpyruvate tautomerase PptA (4-oxalocrotonate tautomerase family)